MLKKSKLVNILISLLLGAVAGAFILLAVAMSAGGASSDARTLVLKTDSNEKLYDGTPLTDEGWTLEGTLREGHRAEAVFRASRTDVGTTENVAELRILDALGNDVSAEYGIRCEFGTLTVSARLLVVISASAYKIFDETPLTAPEYELSPLGDGLAIGHRESVSVTGILTEIGMTSNTIESAYVLDAFGKDVTHNYRLVLREGLLAMDDGSSGSIFGDGESDLLPAEGLEDVVLYSVWSESDGYLYLKVRSYGDYTGTGWADAPVYTELVDGTHSAASLTAYALADAGQRARTVRVRSFCGKYALPYYFDPESAEVQTDDTSFSGDTHGIYEVKCYGIVGDTGALYNPCLSYERAYRDFVYGNYLSIDAESLAYMQGVIAREGFSADDPDIVKNVASYIQSAAAYAKDYPIEMESESNVAIAFLEEYKEGVCRHYASAAVLLYRALGIPARYTVGALAKTQAGAWVNVRSASAHAWVEVYVSGIGWIMVEVTGGADDSSLVRVKPATARFEYDGKEHTAPAVLQGFEPFAQMGYTYEAEIEGVRTEPGITETVIKSLKIFNSAGKDVTFRFRIRTETGILQVYREKITVTSGNESFTYGCLAERPDAEYELPAAMSSLSVKLTRDTSVGVGRHMNLFEVTLLDRSGADVTDEYYVVRKYGTLTVDPLCITLKAGDAEKTYDGEALTCGEFIFVSGKLASGHEIGICELSGSQKMVGYSENEIVHVMIRDEYGKNATQNYAITLLTGSLRVTAP